MYRKNLILFFINIAFSTTINYNLNLIHQIEIDNASNNYGVSDVWGYTDEIGNEYSIVGHQYGTYIYKITNSDYELVMNIIGPSTGDYYYHRDYKTFNNHLYIVNEMYGGDIGMQVIDLSPLPGNIPIQLETYNNMAQSHNLWIDTDSELAFIEHQNGDNIHIVDLSIPNTPTYAGSFGNQALNCHDIYTKNNIAYISEGWSYQFGIYDINNLNDIIQLATIPSTGYAHNAWLSDDGSHLITTEETENETIKIWDITNLNDIILKGEYLGENNLAHNVHVLNNLLYISHYTTGLKIVDIFNPERPIEIAAYDTYPLNNDGGYYGCWGAYPYTQNSHIYASDMQNGLYVFNFDDISAGFINGHLYYEDINSPAINSSIKSLLNEKMYYTDENGYYNFGHAEGTHEFIINNTDTLELIIFPHLETFQDYFINNNVLLGDVNLDSYIDILDIVLTVNIVFNNNYTIYADLNQDGLVNIQDIVLIVNLILNN